MNEQADGAEGTQEDQPEKPDQRERVKQLVGKLVDGSGLQVRELANGLVIMNPLDLDRGHVHVAFADGYVCWERSVWEYWGMIEGLKDMYSTQGYPWEENPGDAFVAWGRVVGVLGLRCKVQGSSS